jgi:hypothetical protein
MQVWVAVFAAVVAAAAFIFSVWTRRASERQAQLQRWQRVVIYSLIDELKTASFKQLKDAYLQKAQQLLTPKCAEK